MTPNSNKGSKHDIKISSSLLKRASKDDTDAIITMFKQFIPETEEIYFAQYLGLQGIWGVGNREFACLTDRRVADITVGRFGEVTYQDGYLEHINSTFIYQPSKLGLYLTVATIVIFTLGIGLILLPLIVQGYYRLNKCGIVIAVRGGLPIYIFTNRGLLTRANQLLRLLTMSRETRIKLRGVV
jgi:hypothetical protein